MTHLDQFLQKRPSFDSSEIENVNQWDSQAKDWRTQIYENEYKPLHRCIKHFIKGTLIVLGFLMALNYGTWHFRNALCQWGVNGACIQLNSASLDNLMNSKKRKGEPCPTGSTICSPIMSPSLSVTHLPSP